jgi:hypothetical protein
MSQPDKALAALREVAGGHAVQGGYFTALTLEGVRPNVGYPANCLPKTTFAEMKIVPSFVAALQKNH